VIGREHVEEALAVDAAPGPTPPAGPAPAVPVGAPSLRDVERQTLRAALAAHRGTRAELARRLGISERSLYRKLRALERDDLPGA
jgi:Response regulator containing CheY-like receiver, AAA-type ATPase, and DNA-binding domains